MSGSLLDLMTSKRANWASIKEIAKKIGEQNPNTCFECSKCTSGCPSAEFLELYPHNIVCIVREGLAEELIDSDVIWRCALCLKCKERCPQEVAPSDLIIALRNLAAERGVGVPEDLNSALNSIMEIGYIHPPMEAFSRTLKKTFTREELGLKPKKGPKDINSFREALLAAFEE